MRALRRLFRSRPDSAAEAEYRQLVRSTLTGGPFTPESGRSLIGEADRLGLDAATCRTIHNDVLNELLGRRSRR